MKVRGPEAGFTFVDEAKWLLNDTSFTTQVRQMKKANADVIAISPIPSRPAVCSRDETPEGQTQASGRSDQFLQYGNAERLRQ
ncbi:MAG: hypothetical protein Ct9H300mP16_10560 [Pseudomonadota bacterium]|nr:MAG: hypothetical protein Ct9H300mP16_10560 [Pseudomonadota bacterium]